MEDLGLCTEMSLIGTEELENISSDFKAMAEDPLVFKEELGNEYECTVCQEAFASEEDLTKHYKEHMEQNLYMCASGAEVVNSNIYEQELEPDEWNQIIPATLLSAAEEEKQCEHFECDVCHRVFSFKSSLTRHYSVHAEININECTEEQKLACCLCAKSFLLEEQLRRHYRCHIKPHKCDICHKKFPFKSNLITHLKTHLDKAPYTCFVCFKSFAFRKDLKNHSCTQEEFLPSLDEQSKLKKDNQQETPSSERTTACSKNIKELEVDSYLVIPRTFVCDKCDKVFETKSKLSMHRSVHSKVKRHKCIVCFKSFTKTSHLQNHYRTHTGERPYTCDICPRAFSEKGNLVKHQLRHKKAGIMQ